MRCRSSYSCRKTLKTIPGAIGWAFGAQAAPMASRVATMRARCSSGGQAAAGQCIDVDLVEHFFGGGSGLEHHPAHLAGVCILSSFDASETGKHSLPEAYAV